MNLHDWRLLLAFFSLMGCALSVIAAGLFVKYRKLMVYSWPSAFIFAVTAALVMGGQAVFRYEDAFNTSSGFSFRSDIFNMPTIVGFVIASTIGLRKLGKIKFLDEIDPDTTTQI